MSDGNDKLTAVRWLIQTFADVDSADEWLAPRERTTLGALHRPKRHQDWRLGRWTVKQAFAGLGLCSPTDMKGLAGIEVGTEESGAPFVTIEGRPVPWPISISHSHGRALCAIGPAGSAVGCDIERVEPRDDDFTREWCSASERDALARAGQQERHLTVTLLWSAKESALKALRTGLTVSTQALSVAVDIDRSDDWSALGVHGPGVHHPMFGWWRRDVSDLITVVTMPALGRPIALTSRPLATMRVAERAVAGY